MLLIKLDAFHVISFCVFLLKIIYSDLFFPISTKFFVFLITYNNFLHMLYTRLFPQVIVGFSPFLVIPLMNRDLRQKFIFIL